MSLDLSTAEPPPGSFGSDVGIIRGPIPRLLTATPNALTLVWNNPFLGNAPLQWVEMQLSRHPRDWLTDTKYFKFTGDKFRLRVDELKPNTPYVKILSYSLVAYTK